MTRTPSLILLVLMVAGLVVADRFVDPRPPNVEAPELLPMPAISGEQTLGSTWYCPGNLVTKDGQYESVLVITNPGPAVDGTLSIFPGVVSDEPRSTSMPAFQTDLSLDESSQVRIAVSDRMRAEVPVFGNGDLMFAGAVLELSAPGVVVEHVATTPFGTAMSPCDSQSSTEWYSASTTTLNDVTSYLMILNPFAATAVVDITFSSDDGLAFEEGLVVAPQAQLMVNIGEIQRVRAQLAMTVSVRSGRVVTEKVQIFNRPDGLKGTSLSSGAGALSTQWFFPSGHAVDGGESYVVYNPTEIDADVELLVKPVEFPGVETESLPFDLTVPAGERIEVVLSDDPVLPSSERALRFGDDVNYSFPYWVLVQSFNGIPVVVERVQTSTGDYTGVNIGPGVAASSTAQWVSLPIELGATSPQISIVNPANDTLARVTVAAIVDAEIVEVTSLEIDPGERVTADLSSTLPIGAVSLRLDSSAPIATEITAVAPNAFVATNAVPIESTISSTRLFVDY